MPNDPRRKFKKRLYDPSRNLIFEERTGGGGASGPQGGGGGGGGIPWTPVGPSIPVKPPIPTPTPSITPFNPYLGFQPFVSPEDIRGTRLRGRIDERLRAMTEDENARLRARPIPMMKNLVMDKGKPSVLDNTDYLVDNPDFIDITPTDPALIELNVFKPVIKPVDLLNPSKPTKIPIVVPKPSDIVPDAQGTTQAQMAAFAEAQRLRDEMIADQTYLEEAEALGKTTLGKRIANMISGGKTQSYIDSVINKIKQNQAAKAVRLQDAVLSIEDQLKIALMDVKDPRLTAGQVRTLKYKIGDLKNEIEARAANKVTAAAAKYFGNKTTSNKGLFTKAQKNLEKIQSDFGFADRFDPLDFNVPNEPRLDYLKLDLAQGIDEAGNPLTAEGRRQLIERIKQRESASSSSATKPKLTPKEAITEMLRLQQEVQRSSAEDVEVQKLQEQINQRRAEDLELAQAQAKLNEIRGGSANPEARSREGSLAGRTLEESLGEVRLPARPREGSLTTQTLEDSLALDRQMAEMTARQEARRPAVRPEATEAEAGGIGLDFTQPSAGEQAARARGYLDDAPAEPADMIEFGGLSAQNDIVNFNEYYERLVEGSKAWDFKIPDIPESIRAQGELAVKKYVAKKAIDYMHEPGRPGLQKTEIVRGVRQPGKTKMSAKKSLRNLEYHYDKAVRQQASLSQTQQVRAPTGTPGASPPPTPPEFELHGLDSGENSRAGSGTTSRDSNISLESTPEQRRSVMDTLNRGKYDRVDILDTIDDLGGNVERGGRVATNDIELEDLGGNVERGGRLPQDVADVAPTRPQDVAPTRPTQPTQPTQPKAPRGLEAMELETVDLAPPKPLGRGRAKIAPKPTPQATQKFGGSIQELTYNKLVSNEFINNARTFGNSLRGLGNRIPVLKAPSVNTIKRYGGEVGGTLGGVAIGIGISYLMAQYFKQHPATDIYSQIGQQYAVGLSGVAGASIIMKAIQIAGRLGVRKMASTAAAKMLLYESAAATGEGAVVIAAQMAVEIGTEALMDRYKYNHEQSKATAAAAGSVINIGYGAARGGPAGAVLMALFSAYSITEATLTGQQEDRDELENRQKTADTSNRVNNARRQLVINMGNTDNDINKAYMLLTPKQRSDYNLVGASEVSNFENSLRVEFDPLEKEKNGNPYAPKPVEEDTEVADAFFSGVDALSYMSVVGSPLGTAAYLLSMKEKSFQENEAREQQLKDKYYSDYIAWYLNKKKEVNPSPPPPEDEGFRLLERDTLGSWRQSAEFSAELNYRQTENYNRVVNNARNQILDEWHASTTTMQEIAARDDNGRRLVETAGLDTSFVYDYDKYIVQDAAIQLTQQFNNNGTNYRDADPKLVAIAGRDQDVLTGLDHYYEVMTTLSKDTGLSIAELARLNALPVNQQERELGKINSLRERVIRGGLLQDKALVDEFNANLIKEMQSYGENFEAIMLNINENQMLNGYSYLYGTNRSDLYRQLHLEAPVLVIENPYAGSTEFDRDKNRTPGDTLIYGYRYNLTDIQNQELEEYLYDKNRALYQAGDTKGRLTTEDAMAKAAEIYDRDIGIYRKSDEEVAKDNNMTLDEYYVEYGYDTDKKPPVIPIEWKDITERDPPPPMHSNSNIESDDRAGERQANAELQAQRVAGGGTADEFDRMAAGAYDASQRANVDAEGGNNITGQREPRTNANGETLREENDPDGP